MASIFVQDPVYITVQQVKDSTSKSDIAALSDDDIKALIYKAQREIDARLGRTIYKPYSEDQTFLFPVNNPDDDTSLLPAEITEACLYTVEQIYVNGDTVTAGNGGAIKKETTGPHTVEYVTEADIDFIPNAAQTLLLPRKNMFISQVI